jgi:hypothetical protein
LAAVTVAAFVLGLLLMVGSASAQTGALSHPTWVCSAPATGAWIPTFNFSFTSAADTSGLAVLKGLRAIECVATTETKFTAYTYNRRAAVDKIKWPIYGPGAADTVYTVPAGETRTYLFDKPYVQFIIVKTGTANFSGE